MRWQKIAPVHPGCSFSDSAANIASSSRGLALAHRVSFDQHPAFSDEPNGDQIGIVEPTSDVLHRPGDHHGGVEVPRPSNQRSQSRAGIHARRHRDSLPRSLSSGSSTLRPRPCHRAPSNAALETSPTSPARHGGVDRRPPKCSWLRVCDPDAVEKYMAKGQGLPLGSITAASQPHV
jgi:hypothetical protein